MRVMNDVRWVFRGENGQEIDLGAKEAKLISEQKCEMRNMEFSAKCG